MPPFDYVKARSQDSFDSSSDATVPIATVKDNTANGANGVSTTTATAAATTACFVDGYPYLWRYQVDAKDEGSIKDVCVQIFAAASQGPKMQMMMNGNTSNNYDASLLQLERISGGVTNVLFKVSGLHRIFHNNDNSSNSGKLPPDDVLVRLFGAEGMINRDDETYYFSILAQHEIAPPYYGRFQNGRLEGWMNNMRPLDTCDLHHHKLDDDSKTTSSSSSSIQAGIAQAMAQLHATNVPSTLSEPGLDDTTTEQQQQQQQQKNEDKEPTLWKQLEEWYQQAVTNASCYQTPNDEERAREIDLAQYRAELDWLRNDIEQNSGLLRVAFCHNDLLAANILYSNDHDSDNTEQQQQQQQQQMHSKKKTNSIQLIDFEYGGWNYTSFDIANHWNEHAGGPPTSPYPDYNLLPNVTQRRQFCRVYLEETNQLLSHHTDANVAVAVAVTEEQVTALVTQVEKFLMPNHLYWAFWAVNQAATEGCNGYDYLEFAKSRLAQYWVCKQEIGVVAAAAETSTAPPK